MTTAAANEETYQQNMAQYPQFQTAIDQLHDSAPQYAGALLSVFPESRQIVETEIEEMLSGSQSPEEAVTAILDGLSVPADQRPDYADCRWFTAFRSEDARDELYLLANSGGTRLYVIESLF